MHTDQLVVPDADDVAQIGCMFGPVFLAVCLSFAEGGEGMSMGEHYIIDCCVRLRRVCLQ